MERRPAGACPSLADALRNLSIAAIDELADSLQAHGSGCLRAARLSCRALRDALDGSVRVLRVTVTARHLELYHSGQLPSLNRWPRCRSVTVELDAAVRAAGGALATWLPFAGLTAKARQRIEHVSVKGLAPSDVGAAFASPPAAPLSALRVLQLGRLTVDMEPQQLRLMHNHLASLPRLETLTLPGCWALEGVGALACSRSLRRLEVQEWLLAATKATDGPGPRVPAAPLSALEELSLLQGLRQLAFIGCMLADRERNCHTRLRVLLAKPPPSLESLEFFDCRDMRSRELTARFRLGPSGRLATLELGTGEGCALQLSLLAELAQEVLLPRLGAAKQQLERLCVGTLVADCLDHAHGERAYLGSIRALRQACRATEFASLCLPSSVQPPGANGGQLDAAVQLMEALGRPARLGVWSEVYFMNLEGEEFRSSDSVNVRIAAPSSTAVRHCSGLQAECGRSLEAVCGAAIGPLAPQLPPSPPLPASMAADAVISAAVRHLADTAASDAGAWTAAASEAPAGASADCSSCEKYEVMMLSGPVISSLVQVPGSVGPWLGFIDRPGRAGRARRPHRCINTYNLLPSGPALLVACIAGTCGKIAAAAVAAAETAAALLRLGGEEVDCTMEVLPVPLSEAPGPCVGGSTRRRLLHAGLRRSVEHVLQEEWDAAAARWRLEGLTEGSTDRVALEWMFALSAGEQLLDTCFRLSGMAIEG